MARARKHADDDLGDCPGGPCEHPGCSAPGVYRAPKSPDRLRDYLWFCLDHVRDYNKGWNYYQGMAEPDIEAHIRHDTVWRRPTWPIGQRSAPFGPTPKGFVFEDAFGGLFGFDPAQQRRRRQKPAAPRTPEEKALAILDLMPPVTLKEIKARYKTLAKRLHPDANGGNKAAEERLKVVNQAYSTLKMAYS